MPLRYMSGEPILDGDRIRYGGELGRVEFVADAATPNENTSWYLEQIGPGCMIITEKWGRMYLHNEQDEDLELVSRNQV